MCVLGFVLLCSFSLFFNVKLVLKIFVKRSFVVDFGEYFICASKQYSSYIAHRAGVLKMWSELFTISLRCYLLFSLFLLWVYSGSFQRFVIFGDDITAVTAIGVWVCVLTISQFKFLILINITRYNAYKQKLFGGLNIICLLLLHFQIPLIAALCPIQAL